MMIEIFAISGIKEFKEFNKKLAHDFLIYITNDQLPEDFSEKEIKNITLPLVNILTNENNISCSISGNSLIIQGTPYSIFPIERAG